MRPRGNADRPGSADIRELGLKGAIVVEDLKPLVPAIADVYIPLGVRCDRVRRIELAARRPPGAPGFNELPVLVEFGDSRIAIAIGDENISGGVPGHVRRPIEVVARNTGA